MGVGISGLLCAEVEVEPTIDVGVGMGLEVADALVERLMRSDEGIAGPADCQYKFDESTRKMPHSARLLCRAYPLLR